MAKIAEHKCENMSKNVATQSGHCLPYAQNSRSRLSTFERGTYGGVPEEDFDMPNSMFRLRPSDRPDLDCLGFLKRLISFVELTVEVL